MNILQKGRPRTQPYPGSEGCLLLFSAGRTDQVYQSQLTLAEYFSAKEDTWLRDYFYHKCLETSQQIGGDGRRREAEAHYNLGISAEKKLDFDGALACMEISCNLSKGRDWEDADGVKVHHKGCESLQRMYTAIAEQVLCGP